MNKGRWMSGIILVTLGLVFLIANLGIISWSFLFNIITLWPLVLIIVGVNIIFSKNYVIRTGSWIFLLVVLIGYSIVYDGNYYRNYSYNSTHTQGNAVIRDEKIVSADLELVLGGTELGIKAGSDKYLIDLQAKDKIHHRVENSRNNQHATVYVENTSKEFFGRKRIDQKVSMELNSEIPWKVNAKIGAIAGRLDFSKLALEELKLDVGAGDLDILFGNLSPNMSGEINAGASNLKLHIPNSLGVKISSTSVLSNTNLNSLGWTKLGSDYISPNYHESEFKMNMDIKMGIGNLNVYYVK